MSGAQWFLLLLALIAAAFAIRFLYRRSRLGAELALMTATETSRVADIGSQALGAAVELNAILRSDAPLTSEFAKLPCVFCRTLSEAEVEHPGRRARVEYKTLSDIVRTAPSVIEDASGKVAIDLTGATVEGKQVYRHRETQGLSLASAVGGALNLGGRTIAHRYTEWIIAPGAEVFVLATALAGGKLGNAADGRRPMLVSINSREERAKLLARSRLWLAIGTAVAVLAALALVAVALTFLAQR